MQKTNSFRNWIPGHTATSAAVEDVAAIDQSPSGKTTTTCITATRTSLIDGDSKGVGELVAENAVIVFGRCGCCMCHVVKLLLLGLGVNPRISAVDEGDEAAVIDELSKIAGKDDGSVVQFPVVFVGGKLFGGLERVMASHISGELVPILKEAKALWL